MTRSRSARPVLPTWRALALLVAAMAALWAAPEKAQADDATTLIEVTFRLHQEEGGPNYTLREESQGRWRTGEYVLNVYSVTKTELVLVSPTDSRVAFKINLTTQKMSIPDRELANRWNEVATIMGVKHRASAPVPVSAVQTWIRVAGEDDRVLSGATVSIQGSEERNAGFRATGTTNAQGQAIFSMMPGAYRLVVVLPGYDPLNQPIDVGLTAASYPVTLRRSQPVAVNVVFVVHRGEMRNQTLAGAALEVRGLNANGNVINVTKTTTDTRGNAQLSLLPGRYSVTASLNGYNASTQLVAVGPETRVVTHGLEPAAPQTTDVELHVHLAGNRKAPLVQANFELRGLDARGRLTAFRVAGTTDARGLATLALLPGAYKLFANRAGFKPASQRITVTAQAAAYFLGLERLPPSKTQVLIIVEEPPDQMSLDYVEVIVQALDAKDQPVGAAVRGTTNADGMFLERFLPGSYLVRASKEGYKSVEWRFDVGAKSVQHTLNLAPLARIDIHIVEEGAAQTPLAGAQVSVQALDEEGQPSGSPLRGTTDAIGVFTSSLGQGTHTVTVTKTGYQETLWKIAVGRRDESHNFELRLIPPEETKIKFFVHVAGDDEQPMAGVHVSVQALDAKDQHIGPAVSGTTDARGEFSRAFVRGPYKVKASKKGYLPSERRIDVVAAAETHSFGLDLAPPEKPKEKTRTKIEILVYLEAKADEPLAGVALELQGLDREGEPNGFRETATTDTHGVGLFLLFDGTYAVSASLAGFEPASREIVVESASERFPLGLKVRGIDVTYTLLGGPGATVEFRRVNALGQWDGFLKTERADEDGVVHVDLFPGRYIATAKTKAGDHSSSMQIHVTVLVTSFTHSLTKAPPPVATGGVQTRILVEHGSQVSAPALMEGVAVVVQGQDASGAATGFHVRGTTGGDGACTFVLRPGKYSVTVRKDGFRQDAATTIEVKVDSSYFSINVSEDRDAEVSIPIPVEELFWRLDTTADRTLTASDFTPAGWTGFKQMIGKADDVGLTVSTFRTAMTALVQSRRQILAAPAAPPKMQGNLLIVFYRNLDANGDGRVTRSDFAAPVWASMVKRNYDPNNDNEVSLAELRLVHK